MKLPNEVTFTEKVWLWSGDAAWHFVSVPKQDSAALKELSSHVARGFGSLPVTVTLGKSTWNTSIFPDSKSGCYILPLKAAVRKQNSIKAGNEVTVQLRIRA